MTETPHSIGKDQPLAVAHRLMKEHDLRHLPVLEQGKLVGLVSERDVLGAPIALARKSGARLLRGGRRQSSLALTSARIVRLGVASRMQR